MAYWLARLRLLGLLFWGHSGKAERQLNRMLKRWPVDAYALASRSQVYTRAGLMSLAITDAQALVQNHPSRSAGDWFNLGYLQESRGEHALAEPAFRRALQMDPRLDLAWYGLGLSLVSLGRMEEAVAALKRNTELQPLSPHGWYQLARVHMKRKEADEARRIMQHLKGFEPKVAEQLAREFARQRRT